MSFNAKSDNVPETEIIIVDETGGSFEFIKSFAFLHSTLTFLLSNSIDTKNRMLKDAKVMRSLYFAWEAKEVPMLSKQKSHTSISANSRMLEVFHHKTMRRMMGISLGRVIDESVKNSKIREWLGNADTMVGVWRRRESLFLGRVVRL